MSDVAGRGDGPVGTAFVLTVSRSGSALLEHILDACRLDILENTGSGWRLVSDSVLAADRSFSADLLAETFPRARFVCLYRHCMDVIASGAAAVSRSGFCPYVRRYPGNTVAAIGSYWADTAGIMLAFEESHRGRCHRVRYEDLASTPEEAAASLLSFLRTAPGSGTPAPAYRYRDSIGRGGNVPAAALPPPLRAQINRMLARLGYLTVGEDWNDTPGPADPRV
jgi:protein-tyrosine sulfotransferase